MKDVFIETSRVAAFWDALNVLTDIEYGQTGMMLVWGYTGRGKTECAKTYTIRNERAVYVRVREKWSNLGMLSRICYKLNGMKPKRTEPAKDIIKEEVDGGKKILLIDEADRLDISCIEDLRDIHDETACPIVLIGEPMLYGKVRTRPRVMRRFKQAVEFGPLLNEDVIMFGLRSCGLKILPEAAKLLATKSKGCFGYLVLYMGRLERLAKSNSSIEEVTTDLVTDLPEINDLLPAPKPDRFF